MTGHTLFVDGGFLASGSTSKLDGQKTGGHHILAGDFIADCESILNADPATSLNYAGVGASDHPTNCFGDNIPAIMSNKLNATRNPHRYSVGNACGKHYHPTLEEATVGQT